MTKVLIAGGTGLIGAHLSRLLTSKGYEVAHLSRTPDPKADFPSFSWNPMKEEIDLNALEGVSYVINLAGAGIADSRWTPARKKLIIDSRVASARTLKKALLSRQQAVQAYVSSSAIGFYGNRGDEILSETSSPGTGFLSESCQQWEQSIEEVASTGIRTVAIRTGIVLSSRGGALEKLLQPARFNLGPYFADGQQWYSWIHIDDISRLFQYALEQDTWSGVFNGVAPNPVRNKALVEGIMEALGQKGILSPVPAFALRIALGEMADTVLDSTRVSASKALEAGFRFHFPELVPALKDVLERKI